MGSKRNSLRGRVIGHTVKYLPQQQNDRGGGITIIKQPKIGAFVTIQVDGRKIYTVPCRSSERLLNNGEEATEDMHLEVNNHLTKSHPFMTERDFLEHVTTKPKGAILRRYELLEE